MLQVRCVLLVLGCCAPLRAAWSGGLPTCPSRPGLPNRSQGLDRPAPLDQRVSFHASEISLREALDRLAAAARVRVTYSAETIPLDKRVCVSLDSVSIKEVLAALLEEAAQPVAAGPDHIVLVPRVAPTSRPAITLDRIVVTGSAAGAAEKPLSVALNVVDGHQLAQGSVGTLSQALNGAVPGLWMWSQSPTSFLAQYGSVRGASSFGLSYPKLYVDGIEVANPLLITRVNPEAIDRIEAISGPQGASLYGADAISGVTNIVLRHESPDASGRRATLRSGLRFAGSHFSPNPTVGQEHGLSVRMGSNTQSAGLDADLGTSGAFIPDASAREINASASARAVGARTIFTGTLRFVSGEAGTPVSPLLPALLTEAATAETSPTQSIEQHTVGVNFKVLPADWWTQSLVLGVDGYALNGVPDERTPIPSVADAALIAARGGANRAMGRWSSVLRVGRESWAAGDLTLLAEHSILYQWSAPASSDAKRTVAPPGTWRNTSGFGGQVNAALLGQVFLTGGLRLERATNVQGLSQLPMLGAAWVVAPGPVTIKLRGAYGKGIRWPQTTVRETLREWNHEVNTDSLAPEQQAGVEGGMDVVVAQALTLHATRFDQLAAGLIQRVGVPYDTVLANGEVKRRIAYRLQNVGEITNRGWELRGVARHGPLAIAGALSLVDSRVRKVAATYTGDLRAGDRMLDVPARTFSLSAMWSAPRWSATVSASRAEDWIYYDRLMLAQLYAAGNRSMTGLGLRRYWLTYPGVTQLRAAVTADLFFDFTLSLAGENLLDRQTGEPDNVTVLPGRTLVLVLRRAFN